MNEDLKKYLEDRKYLKYTKYTDWSGDVHETIETEFDLIDDYKNIWLRTSKYMTPKNGGAWVRYDKNRSIFYNNVNLALLDFDERLKILLNKRKVNTKLSKPSVFERIKKFLKIT